jgi:hypothetical protein
MNMKKKLPVLGKNFGHACLDEVFAFMPRAGNRDVSH